MTAEQQQDEALSAELAAFVDAWEAAGLPNTVAHTARASRDGERPGIYRQKLTVQILRTVLAERNALAARVTELTAEREHDLREVQSLLFGNYGPLRAGIESLFDRRIAELES